MFCQCFVKEWLMERISRYVWLPIVWDEDKPVIPKDTFRAWLYQLKR